MKHRIITFIIISYAISWLIWLPNVLAYNFNIGHHSDWLHLFGGLGPLFGAIITTLIFDKWIGVKKIFQEKYKLPSMRWLLVGFGMPILFFLIVYLWLGLSAGNWIILSYVGLNAKILTSSSFIVWLVWLLFYGIGEESGWRGFLFPEFSKKYNALTATIFISLIWATWHLPIFFYDKDFMAFGLGGTIGWVVGLMFGSVLLGWLVKQSKGILWPVIFWHATFNFFTAGDRLGFPVPAFVSTMVMISVIGIIWKYGKDLEIKEKLIQ